MKPQKDRVYNTHAKGSILQYTLKGLILQYTHPKGLILQYQTRWIDSVICNEINPYSNAKQK